MELTIAILYVPLKWLVYSAWCWLGIYLDKPDGRPTKALALKFGAIRLVLGLPFGIIILLAATKMLDVAPKFLGPWYALTKDIWAYMGSYAPAHWLEWSILAVWMLPGRLSARNLLLGVNKRDTLWRLGGIVVSFVIDVPILFAFGGLVPLFC